ncbi:MAG: hypothetical protein KGZ51_02535 [Erysipelothrix sp.]|jgi:glutaconate CoA-transferase subunit B|nr:hypothetical protein [Erysipelothrix sp.]
MQNYNKSKSIHPADVMILQLAAAIEDHETVFHGVSSQLPMIAAKYAKAKHAPNSTILNIPGGVNSKSRNLSSYSSAGKEEWYDSESIFPLEKVFDLSMRGKLDVAFLGGVQFDEFGNVNASVIGDYRKPKVRLPGGAGSAVLIPTVKKALIWRTKHDKKTFVPKVDFVTTRGNVYRIVTPLCTFGQVGGKLVVLEISPLSSKQEVIENTGFSLSLDNVSIGVLPTQAELLLIRKIDPQGLRYLEF